MDKEAQQIIAVGIAIAFIFLAMGGCEYLQGHSGQYRYTEPQHQTK